LIIAHLTRPLFEPESYPSQPPLIQGRRNRILIVILPSLLKKEGGVGGER